MYASDEDAYKVVSKSEEKYDDEEIECEDDNDDDMDEDHVDVKVDDSKFSSGHDSHSSSNTIRKFVIRLHNPTTFFVAALSPPRINKFVIRRHTDPLDT